MELPEALQDELAAMAAIYGLDGEGENSKSKSAFGWLQFGEGRVEAWLELRGDTDANGQLRPKMRVEFELSFGDRSAERHVALAACVATAEGVSVAAANAAVRDAVASGGDLFAIAGVVAELVAAAEEARSRGALKLKPASSLALNRMPPLVSLDTPLPMTAGLRSHLQTLPLDSILKAAEAYAHNAVTKDNLGSIFHSQTIVTRDLLAAFSAKHISLVGIDNPAFHTPIFAFHATHSKNFLPSIVDNGILAAGSFVKNTGLYIHSLHGGMFGRGIYTSPSFHFADMYGFEDALENKQMVACLICPGRIKYLQPPKTKKDFEYFNSHVWGKQIHEGFDSHAVVGQQFVLAEETQVLPLLLLSYGKRTEIKQMTTNIESQMSTYSQRLDVNPTIAAYPLFLSEPDYVEPISEYWTLHLTRELLESLPIPIQRINTHLHLLIDRSKSMGHNAFKKLVLPACDLLAQKLSPDRVDAVFFGSTVSHFPRVHASSFFRTREEVLGMKLEDGTDLLGAYRCAVETALRLVEAERREVEDALVEKAEKIVEKVTRRDAEALAKLERLNKSKRDGREAPVGFMDAEEIAVRDFKVKSQAVRKGLREPLPETVHVFVLITDGVDTFNSEEQIDSVLEEYQKKVTGANLKTLFRVISIGKNSSTRICLKFHMATQTLFQSAQAMPPVWHCSKVYEVPVVAANLGSSVRSTLSLISISTIDMHVQNGFLTKWTLPPKWHIWTSAPSTSTSVAILFRGRVPPNLTINTCLVNVTLRSNVIGDANTDLSLLRECVIDVKVAAVTRLDFAAQLKELLNVINLVKVSRMRAQSLVYLYFKVSASTASFKSVSVACKSPQGHQTLSMNLNPSTGNYETSILPESNKLDFHFIVDGRWTTSPDYKVETDELGRDYNTLCFQKSDSRYLAHLDPEARVHLMREKKSLMMDLDALVNGLEVDCAATSSRLNSEEAAQWLAPIRSMKFAHAALKRARGDEGVAHEDDFAEDVAKVKEWVKLASQSVVHHELPVSTQSLQNGLKHLTDVAALDIRGMTLSEYLYSVGFVGLGIRVFRSQAAIANPWMLLVQYISTDYWDTASSMCMLHAGLKWHDSKGQVVEDVLIISDPISDPIYKLATSLSIHKTFNSIVFARNPDLYTPQQRVALLGLSFVTAVEQLYHPDTKALGKPKIRKMVEAVFNIAYTLRKLQSYNSTWTLLLKKLVQPNPALYLTEAEALPGVGTDTGGVQSVAQVLTAIGCIACFEVGSHSTSGFELFPPSVDKDVLARAALAILAESVSRGCRIMIKSDDGDESVLARSRRLLRKALCIGTDNFDATGMVPMPNVAGWILKGKKASGKFFRHPFWRSNASPQAVAACLAFSRTCATIWYREEARPSLEKVMSDPSKRAELFDTLVEAVIKDGGMHDFLVLYSHDIVDVSHDGLALASKDLLQVALYAQGVRYFDAKARRAAAEHLNLQDPYKLVQSIIQEERLSLQQDWILERHRELVKLTREVAQQKRRELRLVEQEAFLNTHLFAITRLFTPSDVAHLNQGRPANDQLEVLDTGLLKHHCCSPECPEFLVNQASDNDRLLNRRNGLYNHLKWYTLPDRRYANALHVTIKHLTLMHSKATHDASKVEELVLHDVCGHPKLKDFVMREGRAVLENWVHDAVRQYLKMK